eukprot:gene4251-4816_t
MSNINLITLEQLQSVLDNVDWNLCFICQHNSNEDVQNPKDKTGFNPNKNTYHTTAGYLKEFETLNALPAQLLRRCASYENKESFADAMLQNNAVFHKSCVSLYNKQKLNRKRKYQESLNEKQGEEELRNKDPAVTAQPSQRPSRRSIDMKNFAMACFFCGEQDDKANLHQCETLTVHQRVKRCAEDLGDTHILAKLSEGDMVAIEAKYHVKCLVRFYNNHRAHARKTRSNDNNENAIMKGIALSEVVNLIQGKILIDKQTPVFYMKDLRQVYEDRLRFLGAPEDIIKNVNVTRLKNDLLREIPGMCEQKNGKYVILTVEEQFGKALIECSQSTLQDDGIILSKAARIVRRFLFASDESFDGDLSRIRQKSSVPLPLLNLVSLIIDGESSFEDMSPFAESIAVNLAQLLRFNAVKTKRRSKGYVRHSRNNEPPLPVKIGLMIHAKTRKKSIVNALADEGLSISNKRVEELENSITKQLCVKYNEDGMVCPPALTNGIFTTAAIDNIDHDPSSVGAKSSFHGTSISIFQHLDSEMSKRPSFTLDENVSSLSKMDLPKVFRDIMPVPGGKPQYPAMGKESTTTSSPEDIDIDRNAADWINGLRQVDDEDPSLNEKRVSFSAFFASKLFINKTVKDISTMMPLLKESINSPAMVSHCLNVICHLTSKLNPRQIPVVTADQPVYALAKQEQWKQPGKFKECLIMLGPLHIEMAFLSAIGDWLEGSGWTTVFERAQISTIGRIESFLSGTKVKRSRYAHQVSLAALVTMSHRAFKSQQILCSYDEWKENLRKASATASYWFTVIDLEILMFTFISSIRTGQFELFVACLQRIAHWMFTLDHVHYARWLPVFIEDLQNVSEHQKPIADAFKKGFFTIRKSNNPFSNMGIDQAHEQNNKVVKIDGGAIGLLDNEAALLKWAVASPIIGDILEQSEEQQIKEGHVFKHHEDTNSFEERFIKDRKSFLGAFLDLGNPFQEEEASLVHIVSKQVLCDAASDSVRSGEEIGKTQYESFVSERLIKGTSSLYDNIKKNSLLLFRYKNDIVTSKSRQKIASLSADRQLYANLYVACQAREGDLDNFFAHENHSYPVSLSEYGRLRKCTAKSDFLKCLEDLEDARLEPVDVEAKIVDAAAFVNINAPKLSQTYGEYCSVELVDKVRKLSKDVKRLDFVFDIYKSDSIKAQTRENRGKGERFSVRKETPISRRFQDFMRHDDNKTELFKMLAENVINVESNQTTIIATMLEKAVTRYQCLQAEGRRQLGKYGRSCHQAYYLVKKTLPGLNAL